MLTVFSFSCSLIEDFKNIEIPEKITIKTDADYSLPLGSRKVSLSEKLNVASLKEKLEENASDTKFSIYDYQPRDDSSQQFIFDYNIAEVPLDISEYLSKLDDLDLSSSENSLSQEFEIPKAEQSFEKTVDVDFNKMLREKLDVSLELTIPEIPTYLPGDQQELPAVNFDVTKPDFEYMEFADGSVILSAEWLKESETETLDGTVQLSLILEDANGTELGTSAMTTIYADGVVQNNEVPFSMKNKTITPNMKLRATVKGNDGNAGVKHKFKIKMDFSDDIKIKKISKLTFDDEDTAEYASNFTEKISVADLGSKIKTAVIKEGELTYNIKIPEGWTGIDISSEFTTSGALKITGDRAVDIVSEENYVVNKKIDLAELTLFPNNTPEDIVTDAKVAFSIKEANLSFDYDADGNCTDTILFNLATKIGSLENVKLDFSGVVDASNLAKEISVALPEEMKAYIDSIGFKKIGIEGKIESNLPSTDLKLETILNSEFFDIKGVFGDENSTRTVIDFDDLNHDLTEDTATDFSLIKNYEGYGGEENPGVFVKKLEDAGDIDFKVEFDFYGDDADKNIITFESITLGEKLKIDFVVKFIYDWDFVTLKTDSAGVKGEIDSGMNIKSMFESFMSGDLSEIVDKFALQDDAIFGNICVSKPKIENEDGSDVLDLFQGISGKVSVDYGAENPELLFDGNPEFQTVTKTLEELADENGVLDETDYAFFKDKGAIEGQTLVNMINEKPEQMKFTYDLAVTGGNGETLKITKAQIEELQNNSETAGSTSIKIGLIMGMKLKFKTTDDIEVEDILAAVDSQIETDLFGRESASEENETVEAVEDMLNRVSLEYLIWTNTNLNLTAKIAADDGSKNFNKELSLSGSDAWQNRKILALSRDDIDSMLGIYPFCPKIGISIPQTDDLTIPRSACFGVRAVITVDVDGEYVVMGGEK